MSWLKIHRSVCQIDDLVKKASSLNGDPELQSHWAQYLCVRCAGLLERSIVSMIGDYCEQQCSPDVHRYVQRQLKGFQNASHEKILRLFGSFDSQWSDQIEEFLVDHRKASIGSILANRNKIAHGESNEITIARLAPWYTDEKDVIKFLFSLLFKTLPTIRI